MILCETCGAAHPCSLPWGADVLNTPSPYACTPYMWARIPFLVQLEQQEKAGELVKPPHIGGMSLRQLAYNCVNDR